MILTRKIKNFFSTTTSIRNYSRPCCNRAPTASFRRYPVPTCTIRVDAAHRVYRACFWLFNFFVSSFSFRSFAAHGLPATVRRTVSYGFRIATVTIVIPLLSLRVARTVPPSTRSRTNDDRRYKMRTQTQRNITCYKSPPART